MEINKTTLRFAIVGSIAVALLLPLAIIQNLVDERECYYHTAAQSITDGWGNAQTLTGPLLIVPQRSAGVWEMEGKPAPRMAILAQRVNAEIHVQHEVRRRGIFEVPVYVTNVTIEGAFPTHNLANSQDFEGSLDWSKAKIVFAISDTHGIRNVTLTAANGQRELQPLASNAWLTGGLQADVDLKAIQGQGDDATFGLSLSLRGSTSLSAVLPAARSELSMTSSWPHPSFRGRYLPDTLSTSDTGFKATWANHEFSQAFPKTWAVTATPQVLENKAVAVDLYEPVSAYRSVERGVKYGALFVAITFVTLLCFELAANLRFHFAQYAAAGFAMLIFFLALLSLAEHLAFAAAYGIASVVMVALTGWYVSRITRTRRLAAVFSAVLLSVYSVMFLLLRMEAYALLAGTLVVLAGLAALMWTTQGLTQAKPDGDGTA